MKRNLFHSKKKINFIYKFLTIFILFIVLITFYYFNNIDNKNSFLVLKFDDPFYNIPKEKGGKLIMNLDKKSLNFNSTLNNNELFRNPIIKYSIQLFVSDNYSKVKKKYDFDSDKLLKNDLFILFFNNNIGNEYLLLYKNFDKREKALKYCSNYLNLLNNCLIINASNLD